MRTKESRAYMLKFYEEFSENGVCCLFTLNASLSYISNENSLKTCPLPPPPPLLPELKLTGAMRDSLVPPKGPIVVGTVSDRLTAAVALKTGITACETVHSWGRSTAADVAGGIIQKALPTAHTGTKLCVGASPEGCETLSFTSVLVDLCRFWVLLLHWATPCSGDVVGTLRLPPTETEIAGTVPVPVASTMACSACSSSHLTVSPSDLCPSSRVSWNIRAAHVAGSRTLLPRPSTFV
ncbi:hypothetical protein RJ640_002432 [Escallonia rubra]|uniref:Uncharacterized protein n=1 Tax=Escallonia rubra TaxID=112253 RepID=A0AA88QRA2_9ASTE|nr:hypothetical protein RJ640_002432 [Escallonia rubra]